MASSRNGGGRHAWVFAVLERSGATVSELPDGQYDVGFSGELARTLGREQTRLTFRKRAAGRDGVELASPGSWLHDQLIRYARSRGRFTRCYLPPRDDLDRDTLLTNRRRGFAETLGLEERRYGALLLFTFRLSIYSEPPEETLLGVIYDAERGRVINRPMAKKTLFGASETPLPEFTLAEPPDPGPAFAAAWHAVTEKVEGLIEDIQARSQDFIRGEIEAVESYYRQLIEEEKRTMKGRSSRRGQDESKEKIELLKVEWERRVQEEGERLRPRVVAGLAAVAEIQCPMELWRCRVEDGNGGERRIWLDLARCEAWEASPGKR